MIRKLDVRATEVDKLKMHECFRPGDLIKAEVISLGTARSYFLSTAKNELGVFYALSGAGCVELSPFFAYSRACLFPWVVVGASMGA